MNWPDDFINKIICGDCLEVMREMPDESIDMCMTSPPYWGLRDYGIGPDQLGLEPTPELYIEHMTAVFHEVKRVLRDDGTLWLNMGDTCSGGGGGNYGHGVSVSGDKTKHLTNVRNRKSFIEQIGIQSKCLCMIPERLTWSLIQDGWILRNKIIWYKPNGMPSSVKDRFNNKWEYLYLLAKNNKTILWQHQNNREWVCEQPLGTHGKEGVDWERKTIGDNYSACDTKIKPKIAEQFNSPRARHYRTSQKKKVSLWHGFTYYFDLDAVREPHQYDGRKDTKYKGGPKDVSIRGHERWPSCLGKNPGDVFEIPTQPFPEAHFAVFPEKLCDKPIKAGSKEGDVVLDPFAGAGTTLKVAKNMRRKYIGIDVKREYCDMAEKRLAQGVL